jgi:hypothetical protein
MEAARTLVASLLHQHVTEPVYAAPAMWETACKMRKLTSALEVAMPVNAQLEVSSFLSDLVVRLMQTTCYCNDLMYVTPDSLVIGLGVRQEQRRSRATKRKWSATTQQQPQQDDGGATAPAVPFKRARPISTGASSLWTRPPSPTALVMGGALEDRQPLEIVATELTLLLASLRKDRTPKDARIRSSAGDYAMVLEVQHMDYFSLAELSRIATRLRLCAAELESLSQYRFHRILYSVTVGFYHDHVGLKIQLHAKPVVPTSSSSSGPSGPLLTDPTATAARDACVGETSVQSIARDVSVH